MDHTREASIDLNGAAVRHMKGWHFGPFHAGYSEMMTHDRVITKSWQFHISLPFGFNFSISLQK